ncbi:tyrosine-type recombinase/integrase [Paracoccus sp. R12_1]|nr:tyrosine-type recombinase/integrase [Paracoccus sp. R12_2]MBO9486496.1 tyrosine-type recombinase/integrase [Paracoccus sp. R12_1]
MSLEPCVRKDSKYFYAKGRVEYNGRPITRSYYKSTGSLTEAGAWDWIARETEIQIRRHLFGEEKMFTFAEAVLAYRATKKSAKQLIPITKIIGHLPVADITEEQLKQLGADIKPDAATDTWWREIVTPARAVINNLHKLKRTPPIRVSHYTPEERNYQDKKRGKNSRVERKPSNKAWVDAFCAAADPHNAALVRFMFETAARIDQAISIRPVVDVNAAELRIRLKSQKGHKEVWVAVTKEMMAEIEALPPKRTRNPRTGKLLDERLFGYGTPTGYRKRWITICKQAGIPYLSAHAAGRHGFFTELVVRQKVDPVTAAKAGRWSDPTLPLSIYAHSETDEEEIRRRFRTKPKQKQSRKSHKLMTRKGKDGVE